MSQNEKGFGKNKIKGACAKLNRPHQAGRLVPRIGWGWGDSRHTVPALGGKEYKV
jgi:hypothetical protein